MNKYSQPLTPDTTGVYVRSVDEDAYEGPYLQPGDYFTTTAKASAYVGCSYDQVGAVFRFALADHGTWGCARVKGVLFFSPICFDDDSNHRGPLVDPVPGKARSHKRTRERRLLLADHLEKTAELLRAEPYPEAEDDVPYHEPEEKDESAPLREAMTLLVKWATRTRY